MILSSSDIAVVDACDPSALTVIRSLSVLFVVGAASVAALRLAASRSARLTPLEVPAVVSSRMS